MDFFRHFYIGTKAIFRAIPFIFTHAFYWYLIFPVFLMPLVFLYGNYLLIRPIDENVHNMFDITVLAFQLFLEISLSMLLMHFAKFIVVLLLSPLLTHLSAKTERILTGTSHSFDAEQFLKDIIRAIYIAFRNLLLQYFLILLVVILSLIIWGSVNRSPIGILIYGITAYFYGFSFMDYTIERRKLNVNQSITFVRKHRGLAFAIGLFYSALIFVPVDMEMIFTGKGFHEEGFLLGLGLFFLHVLLLFVACLAPILAVVGASIAMQEVLPRRKRV